MAADKATANTASAAAVPVVPKPVASTPVKPALKDITNQSAASNQPAQPVVASAVVKPKSTKSQSLAPAPTPAPTPIKPAQTVASVAPTPLTKLVQQLSKPLYPGMYQITAQSV